MNSDNFDQSKMSASQDYAWGRDPFRIFDVFLKQSANAHSEHRPNHEDKQ